MVINDAATRSSNACFPRQAQGEESVTRYRLDSRVKGGGMGCILIRSSDRGGNGSRELRFYARLRQHHHHFRSCGVLAPRFGTPKSGSGKAVRRWSLLYVRFVVNATKKCRGRPGPIFEARMPRRKVRLADWQTVASTMATTPTMAINSEPARSPKAAFDDRRKEMCRNHNVHTFRCPQQWRF